jgi:hypothetical protein
MAQYNKQTVAQLRQVLKERGIPSTGLTRKAQIVEKLEEADTAEGGENKGDGAVEEEEGAQADEQPTIDAPPDPVTQVEVEGSDDQAEANEDVPGPALSEAGGAATSTGIDAQQG